MDEDRDIGKELQERYDDLYSNKRPYGDWKLIKVLECQYRGLDCPYTEDDMTEYFANRDRIRAEINELQGELDGSNS